jgi:hypothetical protein
LIWIELKATVWRGPRLTQPFPSPNCSEFTIKDEIVATLDTFSIFTVMEEAVTETELSKIELRKRGTDEK